MATATKKLVLDKPVENTIKGARLVRSARGPQRHVQRDGEARTLCGIDPSSWAELKIENDELVTCPLCAKAMSEPAPAAEPGTDKPEEGSDQTAEAQTPDTPAEVADIDQLLVDAEKKPEPAKDEPVDLMAAIRASVGSAKTDDAEAKKAAAREKRNARARERRAAKKSAVQNATELGEEG